MGLDLWSSVRGAEVVGVVLGLVLLGCFGGFFLLLSDDRFAAWRESPEAAIRQQEGVILNLSERIEAAGETVEKRKMRRAGAARLTDLNASVAVFEPRLAAVTAERDEALQAIEAVRRSSDEYRLRYREEARAGAKGEKYEELELADGRVLKDVEVLDVDAARMQVRHAGGISGIGWQDLPDEMKDRFQFDVEEKAGLIEAEGVDDRFRGSQKKIIELVGQIQARQAVAGRKRSEAAAVKVQVDAQRALQGRLPRLISSKRMEISQEQRKAIRRTERLTRELRQLERQLASISGKIRELEGQADRLEREARGIDAEIGEMMEQLEALKADLKRRQSEADDAEPAGE